MADTGGIHWWKKQGFRRAGSGRGSGKDAAFQGNETEEKTRGHGKNSKKAKRIRIHVGQLEKPFLHGLGRSHVGKPLENEHRPMSVINIFIPTAYQTRQSVAIFRQRY